MKEKTLNYLIERALPVIAIVGTLVVFTIAVVLLLENL